MSESLRTHSRDARGSRETYGGRLARAVSIQISDLVWCEWECVAVADKQVTGYLKWLRHLDCGGTTETGGRHTGRCRDCRHISCTHAYTHACMHTYIHIRIHTCMHAYILVHICMHACMHAYISIVHKLALKSTVMYGYLWSREVLTHILSTHTKLTHNACTHRQRSTLSCARPSRRRTRRRWPSSSGRALTSTG